MAFPKVGFNISTDLDVSRFQDNVDTALTPLQNAPMVGGSVLTSITLTSAQDNLVRHGLNHRPQYFIVLMIDSNSTVWSPTTTTLNNSNTDNTFINLRCSATSVVSLWIN